MPKSSRQEVAHWGLRAFAAITDDAIREVCRTAYFPSDLKLSRLEDTEFFRKHNPQSDSNNGSQTDSDDSGDSDDSSAVPSNLSIPRVPQPHRAATSTHAKNKKGPKPGEHV